MTQDLLTEILAENLLNRDQLGSFEQEDEKLAPLLEEVNLIQNDALRHFVRAILYSSEDFWHAPSDDNHPPDEFVEGGTVLHTKRVFRVVWLFIHIQQRSMTETDLLLAAALLHDVTKMHKMSDGKYEYDYMHPYTVDKLAEILVNTEEEVNQDIPKSSVLHLLDEEEILSVLMRLIRCHKGHMSPIPETIPISSLEWTLHLADQVACQLPSLIDGPDIKSWRWTNNGNVPKKDEADKSSTPVKKRS